MTFPALPSVRWSTASIGPLEGSTAGDQTLLGAHYARCNGCKERWFSIRCALDALDSFVAPRFVTTLCVVAAVAGVGSLAF